RKSRNRHAALRRDVLQTPLKPLPSAVVLRLSPQQITGKETNLCSCHFFPVCHSPREQVLIRPAGQRPLLECLRINLQKLNEVFIKPHRDVIVVLNLTCIPQTNLVNKPPQVGNATEESLGTAGISLLHLRIRLQWSDHLTLSHERYISIGGVALLPP